MVSCYKTVNSYYDKKIDRFPVALFKISSTLFGILLHLIFRPPLKSNTAIHVNVNDFLPSIIQNMFSITRHLYSQCAFVP